MPLAYWCVLIAALLALCAGQIRQARGVPSDNRYPREDYENFPPKTPARLCRASECAGEFSVFRRRGGDRAHIWARLCTGVNVLAVLYVLLRIAHGLLYIFNKPPLRSAVFAAAMAVNVAIFVLPVFK